MEYLLYRAPEDIDDAIASDGPLRLMSGTQIGKADAGDVVWVVTYDEGELFLCGRLEVGQVLDQPQSWALLEDADLPEDASNVFAVPGTATNMRRIRLGARAHELRFDGDPGRLPADFNYRHLVNMRALAPQGARVMAAAWRDDTAAEELGAEGGGGGDW